MPYIVIAVKVLIECGVHGVTYSLCRDVGSGVFHCCFTLWCGAVNMLHIPINTEDDPKAHLESKISGRWLLSLDNADEESIIHLVPSPKDDIKGNLPQTIRHG